MKSLSTHSVVEQITSELATRRRATVGRRAAYLALAKVILQGDTRQEQRRLPPQETASHDWKSATAAA